jgi:hypothetical protein
VVVEISTRKPGGDSPVVDYADLLARVEKVAPLGTVVVTEFLQGYGLVDYLRRYTSEPIRLVFGIAALFRLWEEQVYPASPGALMEALGRILYTDVTIYVAPMAMEPFVAALGGVPSGFVVESAASHAMTLEDFLPKPPLDHLFHYLRGAGRLVPLQTSAKP